jgi:hypothetical protein
MGDLQLCGNFGCNCDGNSRQRGVMEKWWDIRIGRYLMESFGYASICTYHLGLNL